MHEFFSRLSIVSVDSEQHLSEVVFSTLIGFLFVREVSDFQVEKAISGREPYQESKKSGKSQESGFSLRESESSARNVLEHRRDGGANCLLTTTPVSCTAQHHVDDGGHPCSVLWRSFDPVVHACSVQ